MVGTVFVGEIGWGERGKEISRQHEDTNMERNNIRKRRWRRRKRAEEK